VLLGAAVMAALPAGSAQAARHCAEPGERWERATPSEVGMDAAKVADAVRHATDNNSSAVRILRYGCLVAEDAVNPESVGARWQSFSLAKSVVSLVFGRAWTLGLIGPDDPVGALFPEADAPHGALLMRHLATMSSGTSQVFTHDYNLAMPDRVRDALTIPFVARPGETFNYWQTGPPMLAASVGRAAGEDFQAFAQREVLGPIGIRPGTWLWTRDAAGNTAGFWGLWMRPDDFGRLGELLRREGVWGGRRLLSRRYVRDALQPIEPFGCYAMLIWRPATARCNSPVFLGLPEDMWQFNGAQGQLVTTFPSLGIMTVRTGDDPSQTNWAPGPGSDGAAEREFHDRVLRAITDTPVDVRRKPTDPSRPDNQEQQRQPEVDTPEGGLSGIVQPPLPPAGPWRARAVLIDDAPVRAGRAGRFTVRLRCPPAWPGHEGGCRGAVTAALARSPVAFAVAPGEAGAVRMRLTPRALRRLRPDRRLTVALRATTRDGTPGGTPASGTLEVTTR
jgi:CubicO group peptidase (beta-lactamase class C family)